MDAYGVASVMHFMLFGEYIKVQRVTDPSKDGEVSYRLRSPFRRYWAQGVWEEAFRLLLNAAPGGGRPPWSALAALFRNHWASAPEADRTQLQTDLRKQVMIFFVCEQYIPLTALQTVESSLCLFLCSLSLCSLSRLSLPLSLALSLSLSPFHFSLAIKEGTLNRLFFPSFSQLPPSCLPLICLSAAEPAGDPSAQGVRRGAGARPQTSLDCFSEAPRLKSAAGCLSVHIGVVAPPPGSLSHSQADRPRNPLPSTTRPWWDILLLLLLGSPDCLFPGRQAAGETGDDEGARGKPRLLSCHV